MVLRFRCARCGKRFKASEEYAGRRFVCQVCGATFTIPGPSDLGRPARGGKGKRRRDKQRSPAELSTELQEKEGAARPTWETQDLEELLATAEVRADAFSGPIPEGPLIPSGGARAWGSRGLRGILCNRLLWGLLLAGALLSGLAALASPHLGMAMSAVGLILGASLWLVGIFWFLAVSFREGLACGLGHFVPIFNLFWTPYYLITRWDDTRNPFGVQVRSLLVTAVFCLVALFATIRYLWARDPAAPAATDPLTRVLAATTTRPCAHARIGACEPRGGSRRGPGPTRMHGAGGLRLGERAVAGVAGVASGRPGSAGGPLLRVPRGG